MSDNSPVPVGAEINRKIRKHRKRSTSPSEGDRYLKGKKHKKDGVRTSQQSQSASPPRQNPPQETEEEYDARLEREEKERLLEHKKRELEFIRERNETGTTSGGIRFKGRGRMKFVDPETSGRFQS